MASVPSGGSGGGAAAASGGAAAGGAAAEETKEEAKEEGMFSVGFKFYGALLIHFTEKEESDEDMGFGLFD